jgi:hypothetical protein
LIEEQLEAQSLLREVLEFRCWGILHQIWDVGDAYGTQMLENMIADATDLLHVIELIFEYINSGSTKGKGFVL